MAATATTTTTDAAAAAAVINRHLDSFAGVDVDLPALTAELKRTRPIALLHEVTQSVSDALEPMLEAFNFGCVRREYGPLETNCVGQMIVWPRDTHRLDEVSTTTVLGFDRFPVLHASLRSTNDPHAPPLVVGMLRLPELRGPQLLVCAKVHPACNVFGISGAGESPLGWVTTFFNDDFVWEGLYQSDAADTDSAGGVPTTVEATSEMLMFRPATTVLKGSKFHPQGCCSAE